MKSIPLIVNWHDASAPIYSAHFEPNGTRLATAGGDNNVRLWRIEDNGEDRSIEYLSTLSKHNQAVNVVRFAPKGEVLASAGDDGNVLLWVPAELHHQSAFGEDSLEDKETWRVKHMCRSSGAEIYDLAWSPDGVYFIIGSMDNIARIYNAQTGQLVRQIAEHSHYVQGVAWDPLNEYVATQSSDRSVHIYSLRTKDGHFTLEQGPSRIASHIKMDLPARRISSPAPPDMTPLRAHLSTESQSNIGSPRPSEPSTPKPEALPMNPPSTISHSRRSSFSSSTSGMRRSQSPAAQMPLPAVMPMEASPKPGYLSGVRNASLYANETLTSFFRRLTFTPDGSLLLTPAGQYSTPQPGSGDGNKPAFNVINTVYIYSRGGINKPPIAHLPGHNKPSVVVKCSPILYTIRDGGVLKTKNITIDTSSANASMPDLPEPALTPGDKAAPSVEKSPFLHPNDSASSSTPKKPDLSISASTPGPPMAFSLPYRIVYAVATQDSVLLYDTQQSTPICTVSNLHCATYTDLTWSNDGLTLLMSSSDGFCSTLTFTKGELGEVYTPEVGSKSTPSAPPSFSLSSANTPIPTPTATGPPPSPFPGSLGPSVRTSGSMVVEPPTPSPAPSGPPSAVTPIAARPASPTRSNSMSSVASSAHPIASTAQQGTIISNPPLVGGSMPGMVAGGSNMVAGFVAPTNMVMSTPPQTPRSTASSVSGAVPVSALASASGAQGVLVKRAAEVVKEHSADGEAKEDEEGEPERKKRRIVPDFVGQK